MKKLLILALCLALMLTHASALAELSAGDTREVDGLVYELMKDGTWAVTGFTQALRSANILSELEGRPVTSIQHAFSECYDLAEVTIPEGITWIDHGSFYLCTELTRVVLPASLTEVSGNPFICCGKLTDIRVAPGNPALEVVDGVLFSVPDHRLICYPCAFSAEEYVVPEGTRVIGTAAFDLEGTDHGNAPRLLRRVVVPEGVTVIGDFAFVDNGLERLELPESLVVVGASAISEEYDLETLTLSKNIAYIGERGFDTKATLQVEPDSFALTWCVAKGVDYALRGGEASGTWQSATVVNCDEWISLRAEPSSQAERLAQIPLGSQVEVQVSDGEFWSCRYQGQTGYALAKYIDLD